MSDEGKHLFKLIRTDRGVLRIACECGFGGDEDDINHQADDLAAVTAENKRLNVRVAEVAAKNAALHATIARMTRERDALLAAMRWYADEANYRTVNASGETWLCLCNVLNDDGKRAADAIRAVEASHGQ